MRCIRHQKQHPVNENLFWCPLCEKYKDKSDFATNKAALYGICGYCKKCVNIRAGRAAEKKELERLEVVVKNKQARAIDFERIDRSKIGGFKRYFSNRQWMFMNTYGVPYSDVAADVIFQTVWEER